MKRANLKKQSGYTFVEVMVVIGIVAILAAIGLPSYKSFMEQSEFTQAYNNLYNAYRFARSEAIKTSSSMQISAATGTWNDGWGVYASGTGDALLAAPAVKSSLINVSATAITVNGRGSVSAVGITQFNVSDSRNSNSKYICILQSGQSYQSDTAC